MERLIICIIWVVISLPILSIVLKHSESLPILNLIITITLCLLGGPIILLSAVLEFLIGNFLTEECWEGIEKEIDYEDK